MVVESRTEKDGVNGFIFLVARICCVEIVETGQTGKRKYRVAQALSRRGGILGLEEE